ncbi:MAG: twin-arginine translocation signal domain-containing protein, partial [Pseudomonadota bacterium]
MLTKTLTRRHFLSTSGTAVTGAMMGAAMPGIASAGADVITAQKKALVFVMLDGGNDSFNMLVPNDGIAYDVYAKTRSNLALSKGDLIALEHADKHGQSFGLH